MRVCSRLDDAIGPCLRVLRLARGWSQWELARRFGCPRTYLSKIEIGRCTPSIRSLERFAATLKVPLSGLVSFIQQTAAVGERP
jgi:transcriptional regulator with XRE-family HTH domain